MPAPRWQKSPRPKRWDGYAGMCALTTSPLPTTARIPALKQITIDAAPGQITAILGAPGSGKSTIVNLLPRFYDVTAGRISIDGQDIRNFTLQSLRRNVGIVQQDVYLFSATIRDNIAYGAIDASFRGGGQGGQDRPAP